MNASRLRKERGRKKGECTWCGNQVPKGRRTWCSDACVERFHQQYPNWNTVRLRVFERDGGRCVLCGFDAEKVQRLAYLVRYSSPDGFGAYEHLCRFYRELGYHELIPNDLWAVDHIKPRVLGGEHELENLRTLCVACHKTETARLAAERAEARRSA